MGAPVTTTVPAAPTLRAKLTGAASQRVRNVLKRGFAMTCQADRAATCTVSAKIAGKDARKLRLDRKGRAFTIATGRATLKKSGKVAVAVRLNKKAARALRKVRSLRVALSGTAVAGKGRASLRAGVLLRR